MKRSEECLSGTRVICAATLAHLLARLMDEAGRKRTEGRVPLYLGLSPQRMTKPTVIMANIQYSRVYEGLNGKYQSSKVIADAF